jgi:hypothetical protein
MNGEDQHAFRLEADQSENIVKQKPNTKQQGYAAE